ncbi:MAG: Type 1 glutamine amidotransferase-like domain-containing protein [Lachnospiraceae bacterium]
MVLFLTSSPCREGDEIPFYFNNQNGFVDCLKEVWKPESKCLIICAYPEEENYERNDEMVEDFRLAFEADDLTLSEIIACDSRNEEFIEEFVAESDVVILSGGHVPTQHAFFERMHLRKIMEHFDGIVIGISAGSMNSADVVYAEPELPGEAIDPDYQRWLPGLGLTKLMIIPHYQKIKSEILDGQRVIEDIAFEDSIGNQFLCLVDGSFVLSVDGEETIFGEAYLIEDGAIEQICEEGKYLE